MQRSHWRASPYYRPGMISLGLHISLIVLLSASWFLPTSKPTFMLQPSVQEPVKIIHATTVTEQQYAQEVKKIEQAQERVVEQEKQRAQQRIATEKAAIAKVAAEQKRKAEQQKIAEQKKAEEAKRVAEQQKAEAFVAERAAADAKRKAEEQRKIQEQKAEAEQQKIAEQKKAEAAKRVAEQQKAEGQQLLQQQMAAEQAALAAQQQAYVAGELDQYKALINQKISSVWMVPVDADPSLVVYLTVRLAPDGTVLNASIRQSSGNSALDQSAVAAVYKASPMPVPKDAAVFNEMRTLNLQVTPQNVV